MLTNPLYIRKRTLQSRVNTGPTLNTSKHVRGTTEDGGSTTDITIVTLTVTM